MCCVGLWVVCGCIRVRVFRKHSPYMCANAVSRSFFRFLSACFAFPPCLFALFVRLALPPFPVQRFQQLEGEMVEMRGVVRAMQDSREREETQQMEMARRRWWQL